MGTHDQPHEDALFSEKELPRYQAEQRDGTYCFMSWDEVPPPSRWVLLPTRPTGFLLQ